MSASRIGRRIAVLFAIGGLAASPGEAQEPADLSLSDLGKFDLETLLNIEVISASKKEEKLSESAAAIYVITQEDIRRSGITSLPEVFRMVPGMQVARINANQWAITSRGFNDQYADKLLVLVDGRTVYSPSFGGVFWSSQDMMLEDLERVEVIRGPGATLWGANAVNGVINIISKKAKETQGLLFSTSFGTLDQPAASLRYGGRLSENLHYRVYGRYFNHDNFETTRGTSARDQWDIGSGGLRLDWEPSDYDLFTLQGSYYNGTFGEIYRRTLLTPPFSESVEARNHNTGGNILQRWTHTISEESQFVLQAYYDRMQHRESGVSVEHDTFDLEWQHQFPIGERHEIVWGMGYRYLPDKVTATSNFRWTDEATHHQLASAFLQDEITLLEDRISLTLGSKFEHNDYTGLEVQPSGRLLFTPTERQSVWVAVSRAVRTPARFDTSGTVDFRAFPGAPGEPVVLGRAYGDRDFDSEEVLAYELGYRVQPLENLSFDFATFYNVIDGFRFYSQGEPFFEADPIPHVVVPTRIQNAIEGASYGFEISSEWAVTDGWRLHAGYSYIDFDLDPVPNSGRSTPRHQAQLRSYFDLPHDMEFMAAAYYVDSIAPSDGVNIMPIDSYVRLDLGLMWRPTQSLELGLWGQNLLESSHPEFTNYRSGLMTEIPRSVLGKVTWSF